MPTFFIIAIIGFAPVRLAFLRDKGNERAKVGAIHDLLGIRCYLSRAFLYQAAVRAIHQKMALMVAFVFYPTTSRTIFAMLRKCAMFDYGDSGTGYFLAIDTSKNCNKPVYDLYFIYAVLAVFFIVIAVPVVFMGMVACQLNEVVPSAKDEPMRLRIRANNRSIDGIAFLVKDYRTACWFMEPLELMRRMVMIGVVSVCGTEVTRSAIAVLFSLCSVFLYREVQPFSDRDTNLLAYVAQWITLFVFLAAFTIEISEETHMLGYDNDNSSHSWVLGCALLISVLGIIVAAIYFGTQVFNNIRFIARSWVCRC